MAPVNGFSMSEDAFPRYKGRRIDWDQMAGQAAVFTKHCAEHLDYSVDLTHRLAPNEEVVSATGESSSDDMPVTWVRYAKYGVVAFVEAGLDGVEYTLTIAATTNRGRVLTYAVEITAYGDPDEASDTFRSPLLGDPDDPAQNYLTDILGRFLCPTWVDENGDLLTPNYGDLQPLLALVDDAGEFIVDDADAFILAA